MNECKHELICGDNDLPLYALRCKHCGKLEVDILQQENVDLRAKLEAAKDWINKSADKLEAAEQQLQLAAKEAAKGCCPYDIDRAAVNKFCTNDCDDDDTRSEQCWRKYWEQKANVRVGGK